MLFSYNELPSYILFSNGLVLYFVLERSDSPPFPRIKPRTWCLTKRNKVSRTILLTYTAWCPHTQKQNEITNAEAGWSSLLSLTVQWRGRLLLPVSPHQASWGRGRHMLISAEPAGRTHMPPSWSQRYTCPKEIVYTPRNTRDWTTRASKLRLQIWVSTKPWSHTKLDGYSSIIIIILCYFDESSPLSWCSKHCDIDCARASTDRLRPQGHAAASSSSSYRYARKNERRHGRNSTSS